MLERLDTVIAFSVVMLGVSLLITVLVQMMGTLFGLRGTNLRWGLIQLISTVHPQFAGEAENVVNQVLRHPIISDSTMSRFGHLLNHLPIINRWTLASTIRIDEFVGILGKLGDANGDQTRAAMAAIATAARQSVTPEVEAIVEQVNAIRASLAGLQAPRSSAGNPAPISPEIQLDKLLEKLPATVEGGLSDLKSWFDAAMDRAAQRFTLHSRVWTLVFAVIVAFALHLDGFRFLTELSSNPDMRASLVASAEAMTKNADALMAEQKRIRAGSPPAATPAPQTPAASTPTPQKSSVPGAYREAMQALPEVAAAFKTDDPYFANREEGVDWIRNALKGDARTEDRIKKYQATVDGLITSDDDKMLDRAASIKGILGRAKFQLVPDPYHSWDFFPWSPAPFTVCSLYHFGTWKNLHFYGILFSSALLSLGAPFWFNALKNLSALRPIIAGKQDKEQK
jgi:hypothetical protein